MFEGDNFCGFSLNRESFPMNYGFVDLQYKPTSMLPQKFSRESLFCTLTMKVFPLERFAVYSKMRLVKFLDCDMILEHKTCIVARYKLSS